MEIQIEKINSAITDLDKVIETHSKNLKLIRDDVIDKIKKEHNTLNELIQQNSKESKRNEELNSEFLRLNIDIKRNKSRLLFIESKIKSIDVDESRISELNNQISELDIVKDKFKSEIEITKTDKSIILLEIQEIKDNICSLKLEYESISKSNSKIKNEYIEVSNKTTTIKNKLKHIETEEKMIENKLDEYNLKLSDIKEKLATINDNIVKSESKLSDTECKNKNELDKVKKIKEEIAELNEIKDNITHEIENAKKKSRSDENRILAIKKEVLKYILDHKNIMSKKQISEFTKEVENA